MWKFSLHSFRAFWRLAQPEYESHRITDVGNGDAFTINTIGIIDRSTCWSICVRRISLPRGRASKLSGKVCPPVAENSLLSSAIVILQYILYGYWRHSYSGSCEWNALFVCTLISWIFTGLLSLFERILPTVLPHWKDSIGTMQTLYNSA